MDREASFAVRAVRYWCVGLLVLAGCGSGSDGPSGASGSSGSSGSGQDAATDTGVAGTGGASLDAASDKEVAPDVLGDSDAAAGDADADVKDEDGATNDVVEAGESGVTLQQCESFKCSACHGTKSSENCAPPRDLEGNTDPTVQGVGAHQVHLSTGSNHPSVPSRAVVCPDCHAVPTLAKLSDGQHMNGVAEVAFSGAVAGEQIPGAPAATYDSASATCTNVYCHRPRLTTGGFNVSPHFDKPNTAACGSCHSLPPQAPHPQDADCPKCHGGVMGDGGVWTHPELHINGTVDVAGCGTCHGDATSAAPPLGLKGETSTTVLGVGAHRAHVQTTIASMTTPHKVFECSQCHHQPSGYGDPAHVDGDGIAEVTFPASEGSIAAKDGYAPQWNHAAATCTLYCHGKASLGATNSTPTWTMAAPGQGNVACGACHALPPAGHVAATQQSCPTCHGMVVKYNNTTNKLEFADPNLHVNGVVDVKSNCDGCHGGFPGNFLASAPPYDLAQNTSMTSPGVGAHQPHLAQTPAQMSSVTQVKHKVIGCSECHLIPTSVGDPAHIDPTPAEMTFGPLASLGQGPAPSLDLSNPQAPKCSNTYCHGRLCDGYIKSPKWTGGASEAICGACHGIPPSETRGGDGVCGGAQGMKHSANLSLTDCATCHPATMKTTGPTTWEWVNDGACHLNGKVSTATCDN